LLKEVDSDLPIRHIGIYLREAALYQCVIPWSEVKYLQLHFCPVVRQKFARILSAHTATHSGHQLQFDT